MAVDELLAQGAKADKLFLAADGLRLAIADHLVELLHQARLQLSDPLRIEIDVGFVVVGHEALDAISGQIRHVAVLFAMAAHADEVVVVAAHALAAREQEGPAAMTAGDYALQVVVVRTGSDFRYATSGQDLLDPVEDVLRDELGVIAGIASAAKRHDPDVVGIAQNVMERRDADLVGLLVLAFGAVAKPAFVEKVGELAQRKLPRRVCLKGPAKVLCSLWVELDRANVVRTVPILDVQVAEFGAARGASHFGLLDQPLADLAPIVAGAIGVDGSKDAHRQHPLRGFVDLLGAGDKPHAKITKLGNSRELGQLVAGEPIEAVDDEVVNVALLLDVPQGLSQRGIHAA